MIHIAVSSDNNYVRQCYTLMQSAFIHSSEKIHFYLVSNKISDISIEKISDLVKKNNGKLTVYSIDMILEQLKTDGSYNLSSYVRLFLPQLLPINISKILYCDCDALFLDDPSLIYRIDVQNYLCAGVLDTVEFYYRKKIGLTNTDNYINAGLVLFNLEKMRIDQTVNKFINCIELYNGSVPHHDQGTINYVCKGKIKIIEPKCNVNCPIYSFTRDQISSLYQINFYDQKMIDEAIHNPIFVHFTNHYFNRPWNKFCTHPLKNEYLDIFYTIPFDHDLEDQQLKLKVKFLNFMHTKTPFFVYKIVYKLFTRLQMIIRG